MTTSSRRPRTEQPAPSPSVPAPARPRGFKGMSWQVKPEKWIDYIAEPLPSAEEVRGIIARATARPSAAQRSQQGKAIQPAATASAGGRTTEAVAATRQRRRG